MVAPCVCYLGRLSLAFSIQTSAAYTGRMRQFMSIKRTRAWQIGIFARSIRHSFFFSLCTCLDVECMQPLWAPGQAGCSRRTCLQGTNGMNGLVLTETLGAPVWGMACQTVFPPCRRIRSPFRMYTADVLSLRRLACVSFVRLRSSTVSSTRFSARACAAEENLGPALCIPPEYVPRARELGRQSNWRPNRVPL